MAREKDLAGRGGEPPARASNDRHNPFEILELAPTATPIEIERRKQKLLGMLELGLDEARTYPGPSGPVDRTGEQVRDAAERLSRPEQRLAWELWMPRDEGTNLDLALELHAAIARQVAAGVAVSAAELDELGLAWDLAFESEDVDDRAADRAAELGWGDPDRAVDELRDELDEALLEIVESAGSIDLDGLESEILGDVARRQSDDAIERLEQACERYVDGGGGVMAWNGLTSLYWKVVKGRGDHVRSTAFYAIYSPLVGHAVDLFNDERYEDAAREFLWLGERAEAVGDTEAAERERDNARISSQNWLSAQQHAASIASADISSGGASSWSWVWVVAVIAIGMARFGRACGTSSPSYTPPSIDYNYQREIDRINQSLQNLESLENLPGIYGSDLAGCANSYIDPTYGTVVCLDAETAPDPATELPDTKNDRRGNAPPVDN